MPIKVLKVGIVGARVRNSKEDKALIFDAIRHLRQKREDIQIHLVSGGCPRGADKFAEELAEEMDLEITIHYPDVSKMENNTRWEYAKLCFERNTKIAEDSDILIATPSYKKGEAIGGTADTIKKARHLGKPVIEL